MSRTDYAHVEPLLSALHAAQNAYGFLPLDELDRLGRKYRLSSAELGGFVSFFPAFRRRPVSPKTVRVCTGPTCRLAGGQEALKEAESIPAPCLGRCDHAPATLPVEPDTDEELVSYPPGHWDWLQSFAGNEAPVRLLARLEESGLTGMGGAGFTMPHPAQKNMSSPTPTRANRGHLRTAT